MRSNEGHTFIAGIPHGEDILFERLLVDDMAVWILEKTPEAVRPSVMAAMFAAYERSQEQASDMVLRKDGVVFLRTAHEDELYMTCAIENHVTDEHIGGKINGRVLQGDNRMWTNTCRLNNMPATVANGIEPGMIATDIVDFAPYEGRRIVGVRSAGNGGYDVNLELAPMKLWDAVFPDWRPVT